MLNDPFMRNMENTINIIGRLISIQITKEEERNEIMNSASKLPIEGSSASDTSSSKAPLYICWCNAIFILL